MFPVQLPLVIAVALSSSSHAQAGSHVITVGPSVIEGALDPTVLRDGLQRRVKAIDRCYAPALDKAPGLFGQVRVTLGVDASGDVHSAAMVDHTLADDPTAECILGVLQVVPLAPVADGATVTTTVLLTPAPALAPRKKMGKALAACTTGASSDGSSRVALARVDLDAGRATAVELKQLAQLDPQALACVEQALKLGPHKVATASRYFQWDLGD